MRHRLKKNSSFGRNRGPRKALIRGLVQALVDQQRIKTTLPRAKCVQPLIEKAITIGKKNTLNARRILGSRYPWGQTANKIMDKLAPRFKNRAGGYTRILKLGVRSGDKAPLAYLEFIDYQPKKITSNQTSPSRVASSTTVTDGSNQTKKSEQKNKKLVQSMSQKIKKQLLRKKEQQKKRLRKYQKQSRHTNRKSL